MKLGKKVLRYLPLVFAFVAMVSCGEKKKESKDVEAKRKKIEELKGQQTKIVAEIAALEAEIVKLDPSSALSEKAKLVAVSPIGTENFQHYIDLQGKVEAVNVSFVAPRNGGGVAKAVFVKKGDAVKKGQLLLQLDNSVAKQSLAAAEKSLNTLKTQLDFAKLIYAKQKSLWDQNIGTEVQYITAKNTVDNLETQLATAKEQVKLAKDQLDLYNVYSDHDGIADEVNVRPGEAFTGVLGNTPQIRIVNTSDLKVVVDVPENYINKVSKGSKLKILLPDINKSIVAVITVASGLIDANSRSFRVEARIPQDKDFHPNQVAMVNIMDYGNDKAVTVPINTLQNDEKGKYVMVASQAGNRLVASKKMVLIGELYGDKLEIKSGLTVGDNLVTEGFQGLYEGQLLSTK